MLELRERNGKKHIVSDDELKAFAWAGYYTDYSDIFINGKDYHVVHVTDSAIEFSDRTSLPVGCYAIFKCDDETRFCNDYELRNIRNNNQLSNHFYCLTDEEFMKIAYTEIKVAFHLWSQKILHKREYCGNIMYIIYRKDVTQ